MERSRYYAQYKITYGCAKQGLSIIECLVYLASMGIILTLVFAHVSSVYTVSRRIKNTIRAWQELAVASHELARDIYYGYRCRVDQHKKYGQRLIITHKSNTAVWYCKNTRLMRAVRKHTSKSDTRVSSVSVNVVAHGCACVQFALVQDKLVLYTLEGLHAQVRSAGQALCSNGVYL